MDTPDFVVYDQHEPCPYLPEQVARMPLRQPLHLLSRRQLDARLAAGDRRCGCFLYRTRCPSCSACEPIRLDVRTFAPNSTQRRIYRKGQQHIETTIDAPIANAQRVQLYNKHRTTRGLDDNTGEITLQGYQDFLVDTCCETFEISYRIDGVLAAVAIVDRGECALSAVYCYFDPVYAKFSLGVYSILMQVELAKRWEMQFVYLGLYIAESAHMRYKANYGPHDRLINGQWTTIGRGAEATCRDAACRDAACRDAPCRDATCRDG